MVLPVAAQRVVAVLLGQWLIVRQRGHDLDEGALKRGSVRAFGLALVIALELTGALNPPHSSPP
jgi:hypothetical protein